jgi:YD repeat-containing protein
LWYDRRGNVVKTREPGGLTGKVKVDGAGRVTKEWLSDGGGDEAPSQPGNWDEARDVNEDVVLEQTETAYDANSNPTRVTTRQRFHDATESGELGTPGSLSPVAKARVSYAGMYYDAADRLTAVADIGTNAGSTDTSVLNSLPGRSDTVLVNSYAYDVAGRVLEETNPRGIRTRHGYDLLGRTKTLTEDYDGSSSTTALNRTTWYTFTGLDDVLTMTADMPGSTPDQTTRYEFGVTTGGGSTVNSNDLLREVRYPTEAAPNAGTPSTDLHLQRPRPDAHRHRPERNPPRLPLRHCRPPDQRHGSGAGRRRGRARPARRDGVRLGRPG